MRSKADRLRDIFDTVEFGKQMQEMVRATSVTTAQMWEFASRLGGHAITCSQCGHGCYLILCVDRYVCEQCGREVYP